MTRADFIPHLIQKFWLFHHNPPFPIWEKEIWLEKITKHVMMHTVEP